MTRTPASRRARPGAVRAARGVSGARIALVMLVTFAFAREAAAHEVGLSRGDYAISGAELTARVTFARREAQNLAPALDADHDGVLSPEEITRGREALTAAIVSRIQVRGAGASCPGALEGAELTEEDGFTVRARYRCPAPLAEAEVDLALLEDLPFGHRHLARTETPGGFADTLLSQRHRAFTVVAAKQGNGGAAEAPPVSRASLFLLGIEHILRGYDHLVFLLGLVIVGGRLRSLFAVVTAFTVAHSISLALAVLGVVAPSPRIVEPLIALSIAYVGAENLFSKHVEKRWRITFPFGLIHGFGFAGALQEIAMPRAEVPVALLLFNLGVEAGQLAVLGAVLPLVLYARRSEAFRRRGVMAVSAVILALGLGWFVARVVSP